MSNRISDVVGAVDQTCPMLFVTVQEGAQTYASSHPSSLCVTMIRVVGAIGDHAIRTARIGLPAVACSASALHVEPSPVRVFGLLKVFAPGFDLYAISASTPGRNEAAEMAQSTDADRDQSMTTPPGEFFGPSVEPLPRTFTDTPPLSV